MRRLIGITILLVATPVAAQKVTIDYAKDVNFREVITYQYSETKDTNAGNSLMADRIVEALKAKLVESGLREVQERPDIYVTYHLTSKQEYRLSTTGYGYGGYGVGWGRWGGGTVSATTTATTYTKGTLIIDAYDAAEKKLIWRGTGTVTVASKPEKQTRQIEKILDKLGAKWEKILSNEGK